MRPGTGLKADINRKNPKVIDLIFVEKLKPQKSL